MTRARAALSLLLALAGAWMPAGTAGAQSLAALAEEARVAREQQALASGSAAVTPLRAPPAIAAPEVLLTVPASTINAGDVITDDMLEERPFTVASAQRYPMAASRSSLVGKVAKRMLVAGNPIATFAVMEPKLVTRGVVATIIFQEGGLHIRGQAMPLESGVAGAAIRLKNQDSGHIINGIVQADGTVKVGG
ncbi:MAG: flagellar basal body P-ring formation chaperone FlgA [Pseudomonadota bacterium]